MICGAIGLEQKYRFGDVNILIRTDFDYEDDELCVRFRCNFETPDFIYDFITVDELPKLPETPIFSDFRVVVYKKDGVIYRVFPHQDDASRAVISDEHIAVGRITVYVKRMIPQHIKSELRLFNYLAIEHVMMLSKGAMFHSSFISCGGQAILFTAPSQTGKSTQAELWRKHRGAKIINGDRSLIKITDGVATAFSLPYCGSSGICENYSAPIRAIVVLRQAPYNRVSRPTSAQAFAYLLEGCSVNLWYSKDTEIVCDILAQIMQRVPVYLLECLPDSNAVETLAGVLGC